ncbi:MAG: hypothetical protein ABW007_17230 [Chitinophagaceae bacterium]
MANYLLLRDNKETGPFSLEELIKFGLKPYDLVWVSGKSAAWRYPSELAELKPYAPTVEEQPFDRFYKKSSQEDADQPALKAAQASSSINEQYEAYAPKVEVAPVKTVARKSVFVTMPGQVSAGVQKSTINPVPTPKPAPAAIPDYTLPDVEETITVSEKQVAKVKYSQPLDEIKEMYVKTLKDRKDRIARTGFLKVSLKRAAVVLGLISVGVLAGFLLKSRPAENGDLAQQIPTASNTLAVNNDIQNESTPTEQADPGAEAIPPDNHSEAVLPPEGRTEAQKSIVEKRGSSVSGEAPDVPVVPLKDDNAGNGESKKALAVMSSAGDAKKSAQQQHEYVPSEVNASTGERNRSARNTLNEMTVKSATERADNPAPAPVPSSGTDNALGGLGSQVSVVSNDYKRVALGGIRNLELTVTNRSKYALDEVAVELQYFKPNDQVVKTQVVQFKSVGANESETLRIPDTNRGVKVQFKIVRIGSSQLADR